MSQAAPPPLVLTFAASDPTGGAGIQADILTMAVPPGLRPQQMAASLERLFREVVPRVKGAFSP